MRKLNTRFFLVLLGTVLFLTCAIFVVHRLQAGNIAGALLFQANQAEKQGRLDQAARYLGRYLEFIPENVEERARLGMMLADPAMAVTPRSRNRARFVLEQVLIRDPQRHALRQTLCRLLLDGQQWENAKEHLGILERAQPDSGPVILLVGELQENKEQLAEAAASYRRAVKLAPDNGECYVRLANLLRRIDRKQQKNAKEIDALVATALAKAPADSSVLVLAAELARDQGDDAAARAHLDKALRAEPKDGRVYQAFARLENHLRQRDKALAVLREGLKAAGKEQHFDLYWSLANLHLDSGDLAEARKVMAEIREAHNAPTALEYLEARSRMVQGRWYEASRLLEKIRPGLKSVPELCIQGDLFLGTCYEQLEDPAQQMAAFKRVLDQDGFSADARKGLAAALWQLGQTAEAVVQYEHLAEQTRKPADTAKPKIELARVVLLDMLQREARDWVRLERVIDDAEKDQAGVAEIAVLRAEVAFARGQVDRADDFLAQALKRHPRNAELWTARASLAMRNGKRDEALAHLESAVQGGADSFEFRLGCAQFWVEQATPEAAAQLVKLSEGIEGFKSDDQTKLRFVLAESLQQLGANAAAERLLRHIAGLPRHSEDVRVRMLLFELALVQKDEGAIVKLIEELKGIEGKDGATWRFAESQRLLRLGREGKQDALEQARTLLTAVAAQRPDWHGVAMIRAEIDELQGKTEQAIANYRRAVDQGARNAVATRQLVLLLMRSQRFDEAEQEIRKVQSQSPLTGDLQRLAVAISLNKQDYQKAELLARTTLLHGSNDFRECLWMGQVLAARGVASPDAEKAFRRAIVLAEAAPEGWVALTRYLIAVGQVDAARAEIEKARAKVAPERRDLALAQCLDALGQLEQAREHYLSALKDHPSSAPLRRLAAEFFLRAGKPADAEAVLRPIAAKKLPVSEEELAWTNRLLAMTLASSGDPRNQREALDLVNVTVDGNGKLIEEKPGSLEDQRYRAKVLALQNRRACRDRAIAILESIHGKQALAADDQFLLVQLYLRQGSEDQWEKKARQLLRALTRSNPNEPRYVAVLASRLLAKNDVAGAREQIVRLEKLEKSRQVPQGALGSVELTALALEKSNRPDQALALLIAFAGQEKAPAERLFQVAHLQGRLGNLREAIDLCERAAKSLPLEVAYTAAIAIVRAHRSFDRPNEAVWTEQWTRLEKRVRQAMQDHENNLVFYLQLADLLDMKGELRELETVCRQVLEREPDNLVTMNNLAWHLAPQQGRAEEALELINRAIAKHGPRPELLDTRGFIHIVLGQGDKALTDLNEAVKENPTAVRYFHLTRAHQLSKNRASALAALQQANEMGLTVQRLHPAERDVYRQVTAELKQ